MTVVMAAMAGCRLAPQIGSKTAVVAEPVDPLLDADGG